MLTLQEIALVGATLHPMTGEGPRVAHQEVGARVLNEQFGNPLFVAPMFGMKKGNLFLAYSYQINTNTIFNYNSGSHQITLGLDIKQKPSACQCT